MASKRPCLEYMINVDVVCAITSTYAELYNKTGNLPVDNVYMFV